MEFWNNEILCGHPISSIKKLLSLGLGRPITVDLASPTLRISASDATTLLCSLADLGYLFYQNHGDDFLHLAARGQRLAQATIRRALNLATVAKHQALLKERIKLVNAQDQFLHRIEKYKFGVESLVGSELVKYLLLGVEFSQKEEDHEMYSALCEEHVSKSGRPFSNDTQAFDYPIVEIEDFLRAGLYGVRIIRMQREGWEDDGPLTLFARWH